jgi:hypothetical protein
MKKQTRYYPQYMSYIFDSWINIVDEPLHNVKQSVAAIKDYHKRYPAGTKMFRIKTVVTTITSYSPEGKKI